MLEIKKILCLPNSSVLLDVAPYFEKKNHSGCDMDASCFPMYIVVSEWPENDKISYNYLLVVSGISILFNMRLELLPEGLFYYTNVYSFKEFINYKYTDSQRFVFL